MPAYHPKQGLSTLMTHVGEGDHADHAHVMPIYQTSTFGLGDVERGAALFTGEVDGYSYTRLNNPNQEQTAGKIAVLEGLDLLRADPDSPTETVVRALLFSSGMAAVSSAIIGRVKKGEAVIVQTSLYAGTFAFLKDYAPRFGIEVVWLADTSLAGWEAAFAAHPNVSLAYAESPSNPTMDMVDLAGVAGIAHNHGAWLMVDNTFASPFCQRPLSLGADVVVHSTTKYLCGHGLVVGGAAVSSHPDYVQGGLFGALKILGGCASPFDAWLTAVGLKTFELRMQRHCENALALARFLEADPRVGAVYYPGLESFPGHDLAQRQMPGGFGGMISFDLKGGMQAGRTMMERVQVCTLAVSLGNVDTLVTHPASTTHYPVPAEERRKMGISDGMIRLSVGTENIEDLLEDLDQAMI